MTRFLFLCTALMGCLPNIGLGQMQKGDFRLEVGLNLQLNGNIGGIGLDVSRNFSFQTADQFRIQAQTGFFVSNRDEIGLSGNYKWLNSLQVYNPESGFGSANSFEVDANIRGWGGGVYYRRYVFLKGKFFGGVAAALSGNRDKIQTKTRPIFSSSTTLTEENYAEKSGAASANLFLGYMVNRHIGLRVSFGEMRYALVKSTLSGFTETQFSVDLRSTGFPGVSVFGVF